MGTESNETNTLPDIFHPDDFERPNDVSEDDVVSTGNLRDLSADEKVVTLRTIKRDTISIPYDIEEEQLTKENRKANRLEAGDGDRPDTATHK